MPDQPLQIKAQRLRIYISETDRWRGQALDSVLLETLRAKGAAGATIFRGIAGFGTHSRIHTTRIEVLAFDLPVIIEVVDAPDKISSLLEMIHPMIQEGLITVEDVQMIKTPRHFLNPLPAQKRVSEAMTRDVVSISKDASIYQAWKCMLQKQIKALPVIDGQGKVVGIITDEDLFERAGIQQRLSIAIRLDPNEINHELTRLENATRTVEEVMSQPVITVDEDENIGTATAKMVKEGLKRLPVIDAQGKLAGILSRLDILRQVAQVQPEGQTDEPGLPHAGRTVRDVMSATIPMVNQDEPLQGIVEKFAGGRSHRLIVVDGQGKAVGLISDSDVVARVQPAHRRSILAALRQIGKPAPGKETAYDLMSPGPLTASPDLPVLDAIQNMLAESRKWLVVIDAEGKPLGLVDRQILLEAIVSVS